MTSGEGSIPLDHTHPEESGPPDCLGLTKPEEMNERIEENEIEAVLAV
jgi:hypothetical protein